MTTKPNFTIGLTLFEKSGSEPLSKRIGLTDGMPVSDGSVCKMAQGTARHVELAGLSELVPFLAGLTSQQAISLGVIRPEERPAAGVAIRIVTKRVYEATQATAQRSTRGARIARTKAFIVYVNDCPAALLVDFDRKAMPKAVAERIDAAGGFWNLMVEIFPALEGVETVTRASTSAGLIAPDRTRFPASGGLHVYIPILDGNDAVRTLKAIQERLWIAGCGWHMVSAAGSLLVRSLVDSSVGGAERLVFEGAPKLENGLTQDAAARQPVHVPGEVLDTRKAFPDLTAAERHDFDARIRASTYALKPERERVVKAIVEKEAKEIAQATKMPIEKARAKAKERVRLRLEEQILGPEHPLHFDDDDIGIVTVADVLADPDRFIGETLADPLEGISYGPGKAKVFWAYDGRGVMIYSFAHGELNYRLVYDEEAIEAAIGASHLKDTAGVLAKMLVWSAYGAKSPEEDRLITRAAKHAKGNKTPIKEAVKAARVAAARTAAEAARAHRITADPRPVIRAPQDKAEVGATLEVIESYLVTKALEPPMRGASGRLVAVQEREMPTTLHLLVSERERALKGDLPAPKQTVLAELDEYGIARMVEEHVRLEHTDKWGFTSFVRLQPSFCQALNSYTSTGLPVAWGVQTLPLVLPDRKLLVAPGLHRDLKLVLRVDPALKATLSAPEACTLEAAKAAYAFLTGDVLVDVSGSDEDKAILVAMMLTVIERHLLDLRPAFFITGSQAETGKTTAAQIVATVTTGKQAPATAWSPQEEERRKALFSYALMNPSLIVWDNIARGSQLSCPQLEKALTSPTIEDRILGISKPGVGMATTVHIITGNRIAPKGDLATRSIVANLTTNRSDPASRTFTHADIISWVHANRLRILTALYTVLMVERAAEAGQAQTRFKAWWELIGRPLEIVSGVKIGGLFKKTVENDELAGAIAALFSAWWGCFAGEEVMASEVHKILRDDMGRISGMLNENPSSQARLYDAFFAATGGKLPDYRQLDTREVGTRLKSLDGYVADLSDEVTVRLHVEHNRKTGNAYSLKILKGALPMAAQKDA